MPWRAPQYATNGEHETFEAPASDSRDWYKDTAASWPKSAMTTTTVEQLEQQARIRAQQEEPNRLPDFQLRDIGSAAADMDVMSFYNGRDYEEGRRLHNQARIARGLPPIREGRR